MSEKSQNDSSAVKSPSDLPPQRERKGMRSVSPPLSKTPLNRFNYYITIFAVLVVAFYGWRLFQLKTEVGGWWNLAVGKRASGANQPVAYTGGHGGQGKPSVEDKIGELAAALGMPSSDLAAAIADAVREHVPPASLSSVAAHEPSGTAVQYLVNPEAAAAQEAVSGIGTMKNAFEAAVGLAEPPNEVDDV